MAIDVSRTQKQRDRTERLLAATAMKPPVYSEFLLLPATM